MTTPIDKWRMQGAAAMFGGMVFGWIAAVALIACGARLWPFTVTQSPAATAKDLRPYPPDPDPKPDPKPTNIPSHVSF